MLSSIQTVYDFMRYCRMPLCFQRSIRDMKIGDTFIIGKYTQPISTYSHLARKFQASPDNNEPSFVAEAWIEKERGGYMYYATWTFPTKPERGFVMTSGQFKINKGGVIVFDHQQEAIKLFALVCRYISRILNCMTLEEKRIYFHFNSSPLFNGIWLDSHLVERRERAVQMDGWIKRVRVNYQNYEMTHQLSAIVDAGLAFGFIESCSQDTNV